jgi:uncharacterized protein YuzE
MEIVKSINGVPIRLPQERWMNIPYKRIWYSYDEEADVLYLNFKKPSHADDSELTDDDIIIRYENDEIIGITVLHASQRKTKP